MSIYITGDTHGDVRRLSSSSFFEQKEFNPKNKEENYIIILGDFGVIWDQEESNYERYWLNWLEEKPFTTLFIDGNHENFNRLLSYPVTEWKGGKIHKIRDNVIHLMRGQVFTIEGKKFFTIGGARSHDISDGILDPSEYKTEKEFKEKCTRWRKEFKSFRVKGESWWEQELPNEKEYIEGYKNLSKHENKIDYILSHSPSSMEQFLMGGQGLYKEDSLTDYLDDIKSKVDYKRHYFGHMHINKAINEKDICIYEQIIRIK